MAKNDAWLVYVGIVEDLKQKAYLSISAGGHDIVIFYHHDNIYALDNRCPHMGFPLSRGSTKDGVLTCDWHHARFDLKTGGCFDLWADDVPTFPVTVRDGKIWVSVLERYRNQEELRAHLFSRLHDGLEQNIGLVIAKSVLALLSIGVKASELFRVGLEHGIRYRKEGWGSGLTILTCMMNMLPYLNQEDRPRALYHGLSAVSEDCSGHPPNFAVGPLPGTPPDTGTLKRWFRNFVDVRDSDGAERCLISAIRSGADSIAIYDMLFSSATDHRYLDSGHVLDFTNKAFEALDIAGWDLAEQVLASLVPLYIGATRMEERSSWRHPVDIAKILDTCFSEKLPSALQESQSKERGSTGPWKADAKLIDTLLGDDPNAISETLMDAIHNGASEENLSSAVTLAAALRIARFPISNEYSDWDTTLHTLTFANAVNQSVRRYPSSELVRGFFDAAISNYLNRFLNVPSVALPKPDVRWENSGEPLLDLLFVTLDKRQQVDEATKLVATYLHESGDKKKLLAALGHALLREDRSFHTIQMLESAFRQSEEMRPILLDNISSSSAILVAATRYLAAHTPSAREEGQTFEIALRLHQGGKIYEEI
jgi:nitrite reductase/ring-hydroxylating ferredoxin subunit